MTHPSLALQKAVVAALIADAGVGAAVGDRIYDAPPRNADFPYVTIGQASVADWSTGTEAGAEHQLTLHAWPRERGKRECFEIIDGLETALHEYSGEHNGEVAYELSLESAGAISFTAL